MRNNHQLSAYFDRKAASFDAIYSGQKGLLPRAWDRFTRQNIRDRLEFTLQALSPLTGKRILDVGCGSGRYSVELAARGAAAIVGLDLSPQMIRFAECLVMRQGFSAQCQFLQQDVMNYLSQEPFDEVIALGFFDYQRKPGPILNHLRPLVRHRLVASFPALWALRTPFRKAWLHLQDCPVYFFTQSAIARLCTETGFTCHTLIRSGPIYLLIAEPKPGSNFSQVYIENS